ncbi:MAG: hypothetical protein ACC628_00965, partial [Pirellulaceae bacterium]
MKNAQQDALVMAARRSHHPAPAAIGGFPGLKGDLRSVVSSGSETRAERAGSVVSSGSETRAERAGSV